MCEYCGCQDIEAIAELTAEHDRLRELSRSLVIAAEAGDTARAGLAAQAMLAVLGPHSRVEEQGLFPAMAQEFGEHIHQLVEEHVVVDRALRALADRAAGPDWVGRARTVVAVLFEHILKEQDGVFPAAMSVLTPRDWERLASVRAREAAPAAIAEL
jgi:hemerythrin-like domain-containing protein